MKKRLLLVFILLLGIVTFTGCEIKFKKDYHYSNTTTTKEFTYKDAEEIILNKYYEDGVNTHYLETVKVTEEGKEVSFYEIDLRRHNEGGANSRLDVFYVKVEDRGITIYDSDTFKKKFYK